MKRRVKFNAAAHAFTLIEMVTSLVILSILLLACGSIVFMATRATGDSSVRNVAQLQAADAAAQLTDDLNVATNFTQRTATAATFTVPDRLSVGSPQVVSYSWSGVSGAPLLRQFNGGPSTAVLAGVKSLNLSYSSRLMGPAPGPIEQVIYSHDAAVGTLKDANMDDKNWISQYFTPSLPLSASTYTLTRVRFVLKFGDKNAVATATVRYGDASGRPTGTILAQTAVCESALSSKYEWIDIPFTGLSNLNPLQGLCVTLTNTGSAKNIGSAQIDQSLFNILGGTLWSTTSNSGTSWSAGSGTTSARMYAFGTTP